MGSKYSIKSIRFTEDELKELLAKVISEKMGEDVRVLNVEPLTPIYFVQLEWLDGLKVSVEIKE